MNLPRFEPASRDPTDDKLLLACAVGQADYLVTEDDDLLVLGEYRSTRMVDALTFPQVLAELGDPA